MATTIAGVTDTELQAAAREAAASLLALTEPRRRPTVCPTCGHRGRRRSGGHETRTTN